LFSPLAPSEVAVLGLTFDFLFRIPPDLRMSFSFFFYVSASKWIVEDFMCECYIPFRIFHFCTKARKTCDDCLSIPMLGFSRWKMFQRVNFHQMKTNNAYYFLPVFMGQVRFVIVYEILDNLFSITAFIKNFDNIYLIL
jgi:hypothetical protein